MICLKKGNSKVTVNLKLTVEQATKIIAKLLFYMTSPRFVLVGSISILAAPDTQEQKMSDALLVATPVLTGFEPDTYRIQTT